MNYSLIFSPKGLVVGQREGEACGTAVSWEVCAAVSPERPQILRGECVFSQHLELLFSSSGSDTCSSSPSPQGCNEGNRVEI